MNAIAKFRKCTLTHDELLARFDGLVDRMFQMGKIPERQIPARPDDDFDLLAGELVLRFIEIQNTLVELRMEFDKHVGRLNIDLGQPVDDYRLQTIPTEWYEPGQYLPIIKLPDGRHLVDGEIETICFSGIDPAKKNYQNRLENPDPIYSL